jgi:hypothetical protein
MTDFTVMPTNMGEDADGTRTAPGGYLDSGKCPAYRDYRWHRRRRDRRCGGGYDGGEQRVLRTTAVGQRGAGRVGREDLRYGSTVGDSYHSGGHPDRQRTHHGGADANPYYADAHPHYAHADAHPYYADAHTHADHGDAHANPHYGDAHAHADHADAD